MVANKPKLTTSFVAVTNLADEILGKLDVQLNASDRSGSTTGSCSGNGNGSGSERINKAEGTIATATAAGADNAVAYDFSAWDSFRTSLSSERQIALQKSYANSKKLSFVHGNLCSFSELDEMLSSDDDNGDDDGDIFRNSNEVRFSELTMSSDIEPDNITITEEHNRQKISDKGTWMEDVMPSLELTEEERYDNARWR